MNICIKTIILQLVALCCILFPSSLSAQNNTSNEIEVYLEFRHRGIINAVVVSYYKDDRFFLPVNELFSLFSIDKSTQGLTITGNFGLEQTPYQIDLQANKIRFGDKTIQLTTEDYLLTEIDSYLKADIFYKAFGLDFTIDFNNLILNLRTEKELPSIEKAIRDQRRQVANENSFQDIKYDLIYGRERPFIDGGFLDYNFSANLGSGTNIYNANTNVGIQLYGGDLQGTIFGSYSENFSNLATDNLRWRYMYRNQPWLSKIAIGQTVTDGVSRNAYTGIRITNEPIEPRRLFDEYEVKGNTIPQSEVELYMNNSLIDFQQADAMGNYRFLTPISYGSSHLDLKIYGPTGQIIERSNRIQVPFTFQPKGIFNYRVNVGQLDNPIVGNTNQNLTAQASGAYGISDWLTAKAGVEYYDGLSEGLPTFTTSISSRIMSNYILTLEGVSESYYRGMFNTIFPNSASLNVDFTDYTKGFSIYNPSDDDKRLVTSAFYPFNIAGIPFNVRASAFSRIRKTSSSTTMRLDASSRIGNMNLRVAYSDRQNGAIDILNPTTTSYLETSATYNISRDRNLPPYIRGVFLRAQMRYQPVLNEMESAEALVSRNIFAQGRFQLSFGRNFRGAFNTIRFSFVIDLNKARTNSTFNSIRNNSSFTQNLRGSVGYDTNYDNFIFTSRDQVGRSGTAIQLFVDNNGNGTFEENEDEKIKGNAVSIRRSGASTIQKNGVLYFTQMQPYFYYNMEMNTGAIDNPMLVPEIDKFGLITDPNRFKKVEIPFYLSGVIEGIVEKQLTNDTRSGIGGLKLLLTQKDGDFIKELRTFSDGSFYDYEVPPGNYELKVDSSQLEILNSKSTPQKIEFEVEAKSEGDFVEGLSFFLEPKDEVEEEPVTAALGMTETANSGGGLSLEYNIAVDRLQPNRCRYGIQLGAFSTLEAAEGVVDNYGKESSSYIVYNEPRKLYAVRTGLFQHLGKASEFANKVSIDYPGSAVLNQCYETVASDFTPGETRYDLQFGAFSNPNRANEFIRQLKQKYNLDTYSFQDPKNFLYKVRLGPFAALTDAETKKDSILASTSVNEIYISKEEFPASMIDVDFEFILQLGEFETTRKATLYAIRIEEIFDVSSKIIIDENEKIILVAEQIYQDWELVKKMRSTISEDPTFTDPIIHLMEIKNNKGFGYYWKIGDQTDEAYGGFK